MSKIIELAYPDRCTGCGACIAVCHKQCIDYKTDGIHYYPIIDHNACVKCGRCMNVCPELQDAKISAAAVCQKYYASWHKYPSVVKTSTSGGVGAGLSRYAIEQGYVVSGSVLDAECNVKHILVESVDELDQLKGSKYVQSVCIDAYIECIKKLQEGKKVFFIGTPCQVEGLKNAVDSRYYDSILTCSIICHGVNSPIVWRDYKADLEKTNKSPLKSYNFRSKSRGWQKKNGGENLRVAYVFASGKSKDEASWQNLFHCWFGQHYLLRQSCLMCRYRVEERNSDIVIGDFWGVQNVLPEADTYNGVSAIITTSQRGDEFVQENPYLCNTLVDAEKAKAVLKGFVNKKTETAVFTEEQKAKEFESEYMSSGFTTMKKKYPAQTVFGHMIAFVKVKLHIK